MLESIKKNKYGIMFIIASSIFACAGQLLWKLSSIYGIWYLIFGFCLYGIGALCMIISYKFGKVSVLQPILSLNYVISIILGHFVLNEVITINKIIGIGVIIIGVILIAGGDNN